jgi:acetyl-CoA C-acetyltransferase
MREVYIVAAVRTAIGRLGGALSGMSAVELARPAVQEALRRAGVLPADVGELIMGQVLQAGAGLNPARQVSLLSGIPVTVPAYTVNMACASGMKAVALAARSVSDGEAEVVVAGGMESMSSAPYLLEKARAGYRLGDGTLADAILRDGLIDPIGRYHMAITAERLSEEHHISREEQDEFALASQRKAARAVNERAFDDEIVPVAFPHLRRGPPVDFRVDEFPRPDTDLPGLAALKAVFKDGGTVTAGNASGLNDGAAVLVLASEEQVRTRGLVPLAKIRAAAAVGVEPERMGIGPVPAVRAALRAAGLTLPDIQAVEINEAFAAQTLAVINELGLDPALVNLNGGAIALGHPVGASGARIIVTLLHLMKTRGLRLGAATLCVGGGQGMALIVEGSTGRLP